MSGGPRYLLLNTAGGQGTVALAVGGEIAAAETLPERGTSEHLMAAIRRVLGEERVDRLTGIGVVLGPGSFTGLRVGLSAAKGLCEAGAIGMIGMSRLALVASSVPDPDREVIAVLDAGRGEFFCGLFCGGVGQWERLLNREKALAELDRRAAVACEARVAEALGAELEVVPEPVAEALLGMVERRVRAGDWSDVASVDANYLRRTDAELVQETRAQAQGGS